MDHKIVFLKSLLIVSGSGDVLKIQKANKRVRLEFTSSSVSCLSRCSYDFSAGSEWVSSSVSAEMFLSPFFSSRLLCQREGRIKIALGGCWFVDRRYLNTRNYDETRFWLGSDWIWNKLRWAPWSNRSVTRPCSLASFVLRYRLKVGGEKKKIHIKCKRWPLTDSWQ